MIEQEFIEILRRIRSHPEPERAFFVVLDILNRISSGEDLEEIKAVYKEDLSIMKGVKA